MVDPHSTCPRMPPFLTLRTRKANKARPRTPPSPGSFCSPAKSPKAWQQHCPAHSLTTQTKIVTEPAVRSSSRPRAAHPPTAWSFAQEPPLDSSIDQPTLQIDSVPTPQPVAEARSSPTLHARRPSESSAQPTAQGESAGSKSLSNVPASLGDAQRRVPTPIKIPRLHMHTPSLTIERTPAPSSPSPSALEFFISTVSGSDVQSRSSVSSSGSNLTSPSPSVAATLDSAPGNATIMRAERASMAILGSKLGIAVRPVDSIQLATVVKQDLAGLPQDSYPITTAQRLSVIPADVSAGSGQSIESAGSPSPTATAAVDSASLPSRRQIISPVLRRSLSIDEGLTGSQLGIVRPRLGTDTYIPYVPTSNLGGITETETPTACSPAPIRSKTIPEADERPSSGRQRRVAAVLGPRAAQVSSGSQTQTHPASNPYVDTHVAVGSDVSSHMVMGSTVRRVESPTVTQSSRSITPVDSSLRRKGSFAGMSTQAQVEDLALRSGSLSISYPDAPSLLSVSNSPRMRTTRLQSAPSISGSVQSPAPPSILSKFACSQFEGFSFLGNRGRSASDASGTISLPSQQHKRGWSAGSPLAPISSGGESSLPSRAPSRKGSISSGTPARPARPPSLTLDLDILDAPGEEAPLRHQYKSSVPSVNTTPEPLRSGRSRRMLSPRQGAVEQAPDVSSRSASGSHLRSPIQQPTPKTANALTPPPPGLVLKKRRETVFPTTPCSFSNESVGEACNDRSAISDFPGFVLDENLLMPQKPLPGTRKTHLPIGPRPDVPPVPTIPGVGFSTSPVVPAACAVPTKPTTSNQSPSKQTQSNQPPSPHVQSTQPTSPAFKPIPVRWRGFTLDAAKWTFSSEQFQEIVSRAIRTSAETSSVRLLSPDQLNQELPDEAERLEQFRDILQTQYKAQVRRRRLLIRSLALYIDGHDPAASRRLMDELEELGSVCDQLAEDLYLVRDQLAQISKLRDVHDTSALAVALRKINGSYIRSKSEVIDLMVERDALQAERDQAWAFAESLERELAEARQEDTSECSSRVSAARKLSMRQSRLSLHPSLHRSTRSSTSAGSMRIHGLPFPRPPSTHTLLAPESADASGAFIPPVPPIPARSRYESTLEPSRPESMNVLPSSAHVRPLPSALGTGETFSVLSAYAPSAISHELYTAQSELLNMLGLSHKDYGFYIRARSQSDTGSLVSSPVSPEFSSSGCAQKGKLLRSTSEQALRRHGTSDRRLEARVPAASDVPEDPTTIIAALTLPQD